MIPLVGAVQELEIIKDETEQVLADVGRGVRRRGGHADRHDDRGAAGGADRRADRRGGGVLLLRHQRPDPDGLGLLPRRRRGRVLLQVPRPRHLRRLAVRVARHRGRRPAGARSPPRRAGRPGRTSRSASAASTAATPTRCTSSTRSGWTTCPARRSGSRSPGWRPAAPRSRPPAPTPADRWSAGVGDVARVSAPPRSPRRPPPDTSRLGGGGRLRRVGAGPAGARAAKRAQIAAGAVTRSEFERDRARVLHSAGAAPARRQDPGGRGRRGRTSRAPG